MFIASVLDTTAIDEKQVQSFFSKLTLEKLLYAAVLLVLCAVLIKLILKAADKLFSHSKLDHTIFGFLRTTAKAILIFIAVMLVAGTLGVDTSSLLAILSVAGLAVSLSMQAALSNVAGALMILTAKPFRAGDYVQIGDKAGTVLTIGAVYTSLRTYDNQIIYLPNSQITAGSIINVTSEAVRRVDVNVSASYDDAVDTVRAAPQRTKRHSATGLSRHTSSPMATIRSSMSCASGRVRRTIGPAITTCWMDFRKPFPPRASRCPIHISMFIWNHKKRNIGISHIIFYIKSELSKIMSIVLAFCIIKVLI